jgi:2-dehydropantoate 2-reductase
VNILIVGGGAIGILFAYFLIQSGQRVTMLEINRERVEKITREGLIIESERGVSTVRVEIFTSPKEIGEADFVILCVKSYDTEKAVQEVAPVLKSGTPVLTIQNGLGNVEIIARAVGMENTLGGITAHGATDLGSGKIRHAGRGETIIGALSKESREKAVEIASLLNGAGIETALTDDVEGILWSKALINAAINPLTAILRLRNGELLEYPETREIMRSVVEEAAAVAKTKGIQVKWVDPVVQTERVCQATAMNYSSMLQDVLNHKRTEIDFINGAIVREGEALGIPVPVNKTLTLLVKAMEAINLKKNKERHHERISGKGRD